MKLVFLFFISFISYSALSQSANLNFINTKLDNGLEVIIIDDKSSPIVHASLCVKEGISYLADSLQGIHLLNSLLFDAANEKFPSREFMNRRLHNNFIEYDFKLHNQVHNYNLSAYKNKVDTCLKIIADAALYPVFLEDEIEYAKFKSDSIFKSLRFQNSYLIDERKNKIYTQFSETSFLPIENFSNLKTLTRNDLLAYRKKYFNPQNCVIIIKGDINKDKVLLKIQSLFSEWKNNNTIQKDNISKSLKYSYQAIATSSTTQFPILTISYPILIDNDLKYFQSLIIKEYLTINIGSLKDKFIENGLAYDVIVNIAEYGKISEINITCICVPEHTKDCYSELINTLDNYTSNNMKVAYEFQLAKKLAQHTYEYSLENSENKLDALSLFWSNNGLNTFFGYKKLFSIITIDDLKSFFKNNIENKPSIRILLISKNLHDAYHTNKFFIDIENIADVKFKFSTNTDFIDSENLDGFYRLAQFIKINPNTSIELHVNQDENEKADLVKKRYITTYKKLIEYGLKEELIDGLSSSLYIIKSNSYIEARNNQFTEIKPIKE
jgi:zinc protease